MLLTHSLPSHKTSPLTLLSVVLRRKVTVPYWGLLVSLLLLWLFRYLWPTPDLSLMAAARLTVMHSNYNSAQDKAQWGVHIGTPNLEQYKADLKAAWDQLFGYSRTQPISWKLLQSRLALDATSDPNAEIPHRVWTTAKVPPTQYPDQFRYWAQNDKRCLYDGFPSMSLRAHSAQANAQPSFFDNAVFPSGT